MAEFPCSVWPLWASDPFNCTVSCHMVRPRALVTDNCTAVPYRRGNFCVWVRLSYRCSGWHLAPSIICHDSPHPGQKLLNIHCVHPGQDSEKPDMNAHVIHQSARGSLTNRTKSAKNFSTFSPGRRCIANWSNALNLSVAYAVIRACSICSVSVLCSLLSLLYMARAPAYSRNDCFILIVVFYIQFVFLKTRIISQDQSFWV